MMNMLEKVETRVAAVTAQLAKLGYSPIQIQSQVTKLRAGVAGIAHLSEKRISISVDYLREHEKAVLERTVAHEVCHHYVSHYYPHAKQHHGPEFRALMSALGVDGSTRHSMQLVNGPVRRTKTITRYVYLSESSKREVHLTPQQHKKQQTWAKLGRIGFTSKGESIVFTGKLKKFK